MDYTTIKTKLDEINTQIKDLYENAKELKEIRDTANDDVKKYKDLREDINIRVKDQIEEIRLLKQKRADMLAEFKSMKISKSYLLQKIEQLETTLQTKPMSMDQEKEMIREIESHRKLYDKAVELEDLNETIKTMSDGISVLVNQSSDEHKKVLNNAKVSAEKHQELLKTYAEINDLKAKATELYDKLKEMKIKEIVEEEL
uniref:Phosphoserine phosphatase n=1 Tax=Methanococcus maripaludis (strain C6 / ATCC BAA-1332) TaxID=444158 RepID=A9A762_METM6